MDTDGSITTSGRCEFTSTRRVLAEAVLFLVRSLGWRATVRESDAKLYGRVVSRRWRVVFTPKSYDEFTPFRLPRKAARIAGTADTHGRHTVSICSIEPVESRPVRCITVDAPDSLYLAGRDLIVTHNTFLVSSLLIAMAIEFPDLKAVWTSHHARTTTNTFRSVQGAVKRPEVKPHLRRDRSNGIRTANGEQEIHFANGSMILFGARALGFGRGMDAVDVEVFDEAQILGLKALEDMVPAANAARNPHGGLLFFIGTPPRPVDDGAAFTAKRTAALAGEAPDGMWCEIAGDEELDPFSPKQYLRANPSYPTRVGPTAMKRMQKNLPDLGAWQREALGIWPREVIERVLPLWPDRIAPGPAEGVAPDAFGVDRADSGEISVCAGWAFDDAKAHVEEVFSTRSLEAAAAFLDEVGRARDPIWIDEHSPARAVIPLLRARRMRGVKTARVGDMIAACALTEAGVEEQLLTHAGQESLARAIAAAMKRKIKTSAGGWVWAPRGDQPIHVLGAASLAVLGASQTTTSSTSSSGREGVAL